MLRKEVKHETLDISKLPLFLNSSLNLIVENSQIIKVPSMTDMMEIKMHVPVDGMATSGIYLIHFM